MITLINEITGESVSGILVEDTLNGWIIDQNVSGRTIRFWYFSALGWKQD